MTDLLIRMPPFYQLRRTNAASAAPGARLRRPRAECDNPAAARGWALRAGRLAALGELTVSIAHEIRNPLAGR